MGTVTKSSKSNITSPNGNSLAVFVDGADNELKVKDVRGNVEKITDYLPESPIIVIPPTVNYGLFSQTENSASITGTSQKLTLLGNGVGTLSVPANGFSVGDSFVANLIGHISCVNTAELDITIETTNGVLLADTQIINMDATTDKQWKLNITFSIRSIGVAGVASIVSGGLFSYNKNAGTNFEGVNFSILNNSTFDTTIENNLVVTAKWNSNNVNNSIYSEIFTLNKIF
jgi:hypothetical protein